MSEELKAINWNDMSDLGLIRRINEWILHPIGLAISRDPKTGVSEHIFVAPDGFFEYAEDGKPALGDEEKI